MTATQFSDLAGQENIEFSMFNDQNNSSELNVNKQIELIKLRVQQLQLKLQIKKLAVDLNLISDLSQLSTLLV